MFTEKELDEIEAHNSVADIPALVAEVRRFNQVVNAAFNLKEVRNRADSHQKEFLLRRDRQRTGWHDHLRRRRRGTPAAHRDAAAR